MPRNWKADVVQASRKCDPGINVKLHRRRCQMQEKRSSPQSLRLAATPKRYVETESLNFFRWICRWNKRRSDWSGRNAIYADTLLGQRLGKRMREDGDRAFSRGVIQPDGSASAGQSRFSSNARAVPITRTFFGNLRFHG
jgi:hypothetical protein